MKLYPLFALIFTLLWGCATPPVQSPQAAPTGNYVLDPAHASITWSLSHAGLSQYTARFDKITGALDYVSTAPENSRVDIRIDPTSVSTGMPEFDETLARESHYFDADTYTEIRFVSDSINLTGDTTGLISGILTLKGVSQPVVLETTFNGAGKSFGHSGKTLGFSAITEINRSDFNMSHLINFGIGERVKLRIEVEFNEAP